MDCSIENGDFPYLCNILPDGNFRSVVDVDTLWTCGWFQNASRMFIHSQWITCGWLWIESNHVLLGKIKGPTSNTIHHHLPVVKGVRTRPLLINHPIWVNSLTWIVWLFGHDFPKIHHDSQASGKQGSVVMKFAKGTNGKRTSTWFCKMRKSMESSGPPCMSYKNCNHGTLGIQLPVSSPD